MQKCSSRRGDDDDDNYADDARYGGVTNWLDSGQAKGVEDR